MQLEFELCNLKQELLTRLDRRKSGAKVQVGLNKMRQASCPLGIDDEARELVDALDTVLRVMLIGDDFERVLFVGRVTIPAIKDDVLTINAADPLFHLERLLIRSVVGSQWEPRIFTGTDQSLIMMQLIEATAGHGVKRGSLPTSLPRDRTYPPGKPIGEALIQMSGVINGPDFELEPIVANDGTLTLFNTYYPRIGKNRSEEIRFIYRRDPDTAIGFEYTPAGEQVCNVAVAIGAPKEEPSETQTFSIYPGYVAEHPESIARYGRLEQVIQFEDVIETTTLQAHAQAIVSGLAFPVPLFDFIAAPERWETSGSGTPPQFARDYWLGDLIGLDAYLDPGETDVPLSLSARITDAVVEELDGPGQLQTKLSCSPEITAAELTGSAITLKIPEG